MSVAKNAPFKTFDEFVKYAKANPGKVKCGNAGHGGNFHMGAVGIEQATGVKFTHIPFKGAAPAVPAVPVVPAATRAVRRRIDADGVRKGSKRRWKRP